MNCVNNVRENKNGLLIARIQREREYALEFGIVKKARGIIVIIIDQLHALLDIARASLEIRGRTLANYCIRREKKHRVMYVLYEKKNRYTREAMT